VAVSLEQVALLMVTEMHWGPSWLLLYPRWMREAIYKVSGWQVIRRQGFVYNADGNPLKMTILYLWVRRLPYEGW
jgi:hypothetical protein